MSTATPPLPDLVLWRTDGCHLCDEAGDLVRLLLRERELEGSAVPRLVERRIADDPRAERELFEQVPVLEAGGRRLPLAVRPGPVRAFVVAACDGRAT
jgi:hypothetical protein